MKANRNHQTHPGSAEGTSRGVLRDSIDDDPEYPVYGYIDELDAFLGGVEDRTWLVRPDGATVQLLSKKGRHVLGVFDGPGARGTADYIAKVNPRNIRKVLKAIVRLKQEREEQSVLLWQVIEERNALLEKLRKRRSG
ncbi:MAG: hypothetical protein ABSB34_03100 [Candidatus Limnocylindrales bacterium]|jgi:hypothetical protein